METIKFLGLLCLTWMIVEGAGSIQFFKKLLRVHPANPAKDLTRQVITKLLNCCLCTGFWVGLFYYLFAGYDNYILAACLTSVGAELFARVWKFLTIKVFNQL